jgi:phosphocarrier protein
MTETPIERAVRITHDVGLHARPSVKLTKLAKSFAADIRLRTESDAAGWIDAKSIVKVMALKIGIGAQTAEAQSRASEDIANEVLSALRGESLRWKVA